MKSTKNGGRLPRALVCGSDEVAEGVLCYLNEQGISIPNQVALISIDNLESSGYTTPPLTTINVQKSAMGRRAVEMIVNGTALQGEKRSGRALKAGGRGSSKRVRKPVVRT